MVGQQLITTTAQIGTRSRTIIGSLLLLLLLFWSSNLIMLTVLAWPSFVLGHLGLPGQHTSV